MWLLLKGGHIIDPANGIDCVGDVLVQGTSIDQVGDVDCSELDMNDGTVYDVSGLVVAPGLVDMHVHMREPGYEHKETIQTASEAAAAGGFTTILGMPNTSPAIDNRALVEFVLNTANLAPVNVLTSGAATKGNEGKEMAEIGDMVAGGAVAISDDAFPVQNTDLMRRIMEYSKMFDVPVLTHCEDRSMTADAIMNEGVASTVFGLKPWPRQAEEMMIFRNISLSELTGCAVHIQHVTTRRGVELVRWAKDKGLNVTAETCPQYISLTDEALTGYNSNAKICPPLRTSDDIEALKQGLADGTIEVIASDHAPHAQQDKEVELQYAAFGSVGLETTLPVVITELVKTGVMTMSSAVQAMSVTPARILGVDTGNLSVDAVADIVVFDPETSITVDPTTFRSKGRNSAFAGKSFSGKVTATISWGQIVFGEDNLKRI